MPSNVTERDIERGTYGNGCPPKKTVHGINLLRAPSNVWYFASVNMAMQNKNGGIILLGKPWPILKKFGMLFKRKISESYFVQKFLLETTIFILKSVFVVGLWQF